MVEFTSSCLYYWYILWGWGLADIFKYNFVWGKNTFTGVDPGFQVRVGALKKIAPSGGRREKFWGISCEKITILRQKIIFFSNFKGGGRRVRPSLDPPLL